MSICGTVLADIELLAADYPAAERTLREQCAFFERISDRTHLAVRAAKLSESLYRQGRLEDAEHWARVSRGNAATDDRSVHLTVGPVEAKLLARRGAVSEARRLAEEIVRIADQTDGLNQIANARLGLAEVLRVMELFADADSVIQEAIDHYVRKGNVVGASQARVLLELEIPA